MLRQHDNYGFSGLVRVCGKARFEGNAYCIGENRNAAHRHAQDHPKGMFEAPRSVVTSLDKDYGHYLRNVPGCVTLRTC